MNTCREMVTPSVEVPTWRPGLHFRVLDGPHRFYVLRNLSDATPVEYIHAYALQYWSECERVITVRRKDGATFRSCEIVNIILC